MNKILEKRQLSANVFQMKIEAPLIAQERKAGQFIILMVDQDFGERIPLTIADADPVAGTVTIIFQTVGASTQKLSQFNAGDMIPRSAVRPRFTSPRTASLAASCAWAAASASLRCTRSRRP